MSSGGDLEMQVIDAEQVQATLDYPFLIEFLRRAHKDVQPASNHILMSEPEAGENQFVTLVGWQAAAAIVVKMVGVFPSNLKLDPPMASVRGLVAVFDPSTGEPLLVADGEAMTFRKTAADSGLGAMLLAGTNPTTLLIVGAGGLAPHVAAAHLAARPSIERILIWNRTALRAEALAGRLSAEGVAATAVPDLDAAVAEADVISCATMSDRPLVKGRLLKPGAHLDLVGAYRPDMRECDDDAVRIGTVFVDTRDNMENAGDLAQPVTNGTIQWSDVIADYTDLVTGRHPGRRTAEEITVCKNVGGAHLDLFAARALLARVRSDLGEGSASPDLPN